MTNKNKEILNLIMQDKTLDEIVLESNLSNKQVMNRINTIENNGYTLDRKYYYTGDIRYFLKTDLKSNDEKAIITTSDDQIFKVMLISDLHAGIILESPKALNFIYDYCAKNDIHIIINTGDLIHGGLQDHEIINIYDYEKQIEHLLKIYPCDKNILNIITLGNHNLDPLIQEGLNIHKLLNQKRHDLISLRYEAYKLMIKNQAIYLRHSSKQRIDDKISRPIIFSGHSHFIKILASFNCFKISIPSLSNIQGKGLSRLSYQLPSA